MVKMMDTKKLLKKFIVLKTKNMKNLIGILILIGAIVWLISAIPVLGVILGVVALVLISITILTFE